MRGRWSLMTCDGGVATSRKGGVMLELETPFDGWSAGNQWSDCWLLGGT